MNNHEPSKPHVVMSTLRTRNFCVVLLVILSFHILIRSLRHRSVATMMRKPVRFDDFVSDVGRYNLCGLLFGDRPGHWLHNQMRRWLAASSVAVGVLCQLTLFVSLRLSHTSSIPAVQAITSDDSRHGFAIAAGSTKLIAAVLWWLCMRPRLCSLLSGMVTMWTYTLLVVAHFVTFLMIEQSSSSVGNTPYKSPVISIVGSASSYLIFPMMDAMPRDIVPTRARVALYAFLSVYMGMEWTFGKLQYGNIHSHHNVPEYKNDSGYIKLSASHI